MRRKLRTVWDTSQRELDEHTNLNSIHITMYLHPILYENSEILSAVHFDSKNYISPYTTDVNEGRSINGPLSGPGEELEPPILEEWNSFIDDCKYLIDAVGFMIITSNRSDSSEKSEYIIIFGTKDKTFGRLVFDLRISDHPFDATFPEELKDVALEYLKMNNVLYGTATKSGIDFSVESVLVGNVKNDSWNRAFQRLYRKLKHLKSVIDVHTANRD